MQPRLSVIVLSYNRCSELVRTVEAVMNCLPPRAEVLVVDNASSDGSADVVQKRFPAVRLLRLARNVGISGWDYGALNTDAQYVVLLDDDCAPEPGTLDLVCPLFDTDPRLAVLPFSITGGPFLTSDWHRKDPSTLIGFINCAVALRRSAFIEAGLNDPDFFLFANEWDLTLRLLAKDYHILFDGRLRAHHRASPVNRSARRLRFLTARNELWMALKYFPLTQIPSMICRVLFWNAMWFRSGGFRSGGWAILGALAGLARMHVALSKRQPIPPTVLGRYTEHYWSFRPIISTLVRHARSLLIHQPS